MSLNGGTQASSGILYGATYERGRAANGTGALGTIFSINAGLPPKWATLTPSIAVSWTHGGDARTMRNGEGYLLKSELTPFHVAVQVRDIAEARNFYCEILGCTEGRSDASWVDFNLFGHQFVCHLNPGLGQTGKIASHYNPVDGHGVPVPHFGVVLELERWDQLAERLRERDVKFVVEPYVRFRGQPGEQATMFLFDPSGNALEFKAFRDISAQLFAT